MPLPTSVQIASQCIYDYYLVSSHGMLVFDVWPSNRIIIYLDSALGEKLVHFGMIFKIISSNTDVESHNSLVVGERHHHPLSNSSRKLKFTYTQIIREILLAMSVKYM